MSVIDWIAFVIAVLGGLAIVVSGVLCALLIHYMWKQIK